MKPLRRIQADFARDVLTGSEETLSRVREHGDIGSRERFDVYRNNIFSILTEVLADAFPALVALAGEDFFRSMAHAFITQALPYSPIMAEYGSDFPAFIEHYEPASGHPYFVDIARLEWARNESYHAPDEAEPVESLHHWAVEEFIRGKLRLSCDVRLVSSAYPVETIRRWTQSECPEESAVNLDQGAECVVVWRKDGEVCSESLSAPAFAFLSLLETEAELNTVVEQVVAETPDFDAGHWTGRMLSEGWVRKTS